MDPQLELIKAFHRDSQKGYWIHKHLYDKFHHDGSCSSAGHCIEELIYDVLFPEPPPNPEPVHGEDYIIDEHGIVTLDGGKALTGDYAHDKIQELLDGHPDFMGAERGFKLREGDILELGFKDLELYDTRSGKPVRVIIDIKGCGCKTFNYAAGKFKCNPWTYTYWKIKNTKAQTNEYAYGCLYYGVLWVNLENWAQFKFEWFDYDLAMHEKVMIKRKIVKQAIEKIKGHGNTREGIRRYMPPHQGNCYCELGRDGSQCYCRHYKTGTTGDFPKNSGANCPGKNKLQQRRDHVDLLKLKEELEDFDGNY